MFAEENGEPLSRTDINVFTWVLHGNQTFLLQLANVNNLVTQKLDS